MDILGNTDKTYDLPTRIENLAGGFGAAKLATLIGMGRTTIYELVDAGRIPYFKVAGMIRFDPVTTAAWLRARTVAAK